MTEIRELAPTGTAGRSGAGSRIVLAGGSGFLGELLAKHLSGQGATVVVLTRRPRTGPGLPIQRSWDGATPGDWTAELDGAEAVINLAGRSVNCRYHPGNRREMMDSRVHSIRVLGEAIGRCARPPRVWINASTATLYKHSLDRPMDEQGEIGATPAAKDAFSIEVARAWEEAHRAASTPHTRKVAIRSAMVLGTGANSVFPTLRRLVRLGLGGRMGDGLQFVSWIHQEDFCRAIDWILAHGELQGPVNVTAPHPLPNGEMMRTLRHACGVPIGLPAARWMLELGAFLMQTETELIIKSRRVVPGHLLASGFQFRFPEFAGAIEDLMDRKGSQRSSFIATLGD